MRAGQPQNLVADPPRAPPRPRRLERHGDVRVDEYYWLRDCDDPEVRAYLEAENDYLEDRLRPVHELRERLFEEIRGRIPQTDVSAPYRDGTHRYYWRYEDGRQYRLYCRSPLDAAGGGEQIILDVDALAEGHEFCDAAILDISPDERLLAYAVDTVGRRRYAIRFRDLAADADLPDVVPDVVCEAVWANDNRTLFYTRQDPVTLRPFQVRRHTLGSDAAADELVYEERDETFVCGVGKSRSQRFILIGSQQTLTSEYRYLNADRPGGAGVVFLPREHGHEYRIDHYRGRFYIRSNAAARNFRLLETPDDRPAREHWRELVPHRDDVLLEAFELFRDHLVVQERRDGLVRLRVQPWEGAGGHEVAFDEPAYDAFIDRHNHVADTPVLRFQYSSLGTPASTVDYDMRTRARTLVKRDEVLGGFDPARYRTERLHAEAADGARVPISLVARRDTPRDGTSPLLLYGYGAYGISLDAGFRSPRLSLLDRGFVYAIAHVRGGEELGRSWYDAGRLLNKKNTFTDFIACAERLIELGYTRPERLFAMGGSAGGLLLGAVLNLRPDLFHGAVAQVPFVDVVTTMLDESIPLTTGEYDEWGDPRVRRYYEYIRSYSPYDNVTARRYPHLLVLAGLHDSQVQYWEPAKWVARLRARKTDENLLLLRTNLDAGHGGASGRYERYRETALQYAFLLDLAGRTANPQGAHGALRREGSD